MKITKSQLKQIIKEEINNVLKEERSSLVDFLKVVKDAPVSRAHRLPAEYHNKKFTAGEIKEAAFSLIGEATPESGRKKDINIIEDRDHKKDEEASYDYGPVKIKVGNFDYDGDGEYFEFYNLEEETDWTRDSDRTFWLTDKTKIGYTNF
jgi:hypothetical protein